MTPKMYPGTYNSTSVSLEVSPPGPLPSSEALGTFRSQRSAHSCEEDPFMIFKLLLNLEWFSLISASEGNRVLFIFGIQYKYHMFIITAENYLRL